MQYDTRLCWLPFLGAGVAEKPQTCLDMAKAELAAGLRASVMDAMPLVEEISGADDGFAIERDAGGALHIRGGRRGVLYGAYRYMMRVAAGMDPLQAWTEPAFPLRMLNHWDNMDGTIERGYAGRSLFFRENRFEYDPARLRLYGRYLASVGINAVSLNNVNVQAPADLLITERLLPEVKKVADILRPFGIRLMLSIDFALPVTCGLDTADPLEPRVQAWWARQVALVYQYVPDLCGFIVKADSEFRPGPYLYRRNHAEGARLLSRALAPHGGRLIWRCFVYNCKQDWRDQKTDRPMAAYETYTPLEGQFDENTILQIKYGPYDFQVREPVSPLLYAMPTTHKALELQLTQEYTGHQIDLYYMPPHWQEVRAALDGHKPFCISAVSNLGNDANWTGHDLAQANLFAYGLFAWQGEVDPEAFAGWWIRLTYGDDEAVADTILCMLLSSRDIYESYTTPLGLCWMVNPSNHYGPSPEGYEYSAWGTYIRADRDAIGIDRSSRGTGFALQYPRPIADQYDGIDTCPEKLLLFFHRLPYTHRLSDGRTLAQYVYDTHFCGAARAEAMAEAWRTLEGRLPRASFENVMERLARQACNAREWRDVINTYFHRYSGIPDAQGRVIHP